MVVRANRSSSSAVPQSSYLVLLVLHKPLPADRLGAVLEKTVALRESDLASRLVVQRKPRSAFDGKPERAHGTLSEYLVNRCVEIILPSSALQWLTSLAIPF